MSEGISIIHGARLPLEPMTLARRWTYRLKVFLEEQGFGPVECFHWSGGFVRSYHSRPRERYARHLLDLSKRCNVVHVFAKSHGALIAERSLRCLEEDTDRLPMGVLLRVATADSRERLPLTSPHRVVDLASRDDRLYLLGLRVARFIRQREPTGREAGISIERHWVDQFDHGDFNIDQAMIIDGQRESSTFAVYGEILSGKR